MSLFIRASSTVENEVAVIALNSMGRSPPASTYLTHMTIPGRPSSINATWEGITVIVRWLPPEDGGGGAIWIYHIYWEEGFGTMTNVKKIDSSARHGPTWSGPWKVILLLYQGGEPARTSCGKTGQGR